MTKNVGKNVVTFLKNVGTLLFNSHIFWWVEICCDVAKLPLMNNERKQKTRKLKLRRTQETKTKSPFLTVNFSKAHPLYKCQSTSFYRETDGLLHTEIALM
jgi:hypothetical protein